MALTRRQKQVLDFLADYIRDHGHSPSYEEIAHGLELASLATVHKHISALELKNYLKRGYNQSRSIDISPRYLQDQTLYQMKAAERQPTLRVPLMGRIAAGAPVESVAGSASLEFADFAGSENTYALEVRGESMIDDHICSGDYVLIERTQDVRDGDIVVALVRGTETTLKRFFLADGDSVRLQPANAAMDPILVPRADLEIQGKLLAVLRKYR